MIQFTTIIKDQSIKKILDHSPIKKTYKLSKSERKKNKSTSKSIPRKDVGAFNESNDWKARY